MARPAKKPKHNPSSPGNPEDLGVDWDCIRAVARECKTIADNLTLTHTLTDPIDWFAIRVWYELASTWLEEAPHHPFGDFSAAGRQLLTSLLEETVRAITSVAEICRSPNPLAKSGTEETVAWATLMQSVMMQSMSPRKDIDSAGAGVEKLVEANTLILNALRDASDTQEPSRTPRLRGRLLRRELAEAIGKKDPRDNHFGRQLDRLADFGLIDRPSTPGRGSNGYAITSMGRAALTFFESALSAPPKA